MKHSYFIGFASGESKKTGRPWWAINLFGVNRYGHIDIIPVFLESEDQFEEMQKKAPPLFSAVEILLDANNNVASFKAIDGVPKLNVQ